MMLPTKLSTVWNHQAHRILQSQWSRARSALFIHIANLVSCPIAQKRIHGADATSDRFVPELQFVLKAAPLEFRRDDSSIKLNLVCRQSRASCKCFLRGGNEFLQAYGKPCSFTKACVTPCFAAPSAVTSKSSGITYLEMVVGVSE